MPPNRSCRATGPEASSRVLDDITILEELTGEVATSGVHLASPRPARQLSSFNRGRSSLGHSRFAAPNPPAGAIIDYWIGSETTMPGADAGTAVEQEPPSIEIEILDDDGRVVRRLAPAAEATRPGIHRLIWDLRYAPALLPNVDGGIDRGTRGPWVLPGDYQVRLRLGDQEHSSTLRILGDPAVTVGAADRAAQHDTLVLLHEMIEVSHAVVTTARQLVGQVTQVREALATQPVAAEDVDTQLDDIEARLRAVLEQMAGSDEDSGATQPGAPPLASQIRQLYSAISASTALPTAEQTQLTGRSERLLGEQVDAVNGLLDEDFVELRRLLGRAGVPWTPGRLVGPVRR